MLAVVLTLRQLACQVGERIKCDSSSTVAGATRLVTGASGTALDGGVRFPDEFFITASAFALGQVLNFGSLAYVADCYSKLHLLIGATPTGNKLPAPPPPLGLIRANLEVLAQQIRHCLGPHPTVSDPHQMFYMLANVHHQIATGEVLPPPKHFWYYLLDLTFRIHNSAVSFQLELECLVSCEAQWSAVLSGMARVDVPALHTFLEILLGNGLEYDSNDIDCYAPPLM